MNVDVHDLAGAYAVDALSDDERRFFERHLDDCGACRGEVDELQVTAALLGAAASEAPPPQLRDHVLAAIATTPQEGPERHRTNEPQTAARPTAPTAPAPVQQISEARRGSRERLRQLLPAVAAVIVLGVAGVTVLVTQTSTTSPDEQLAALIAEPDSRIVELDAPQGTTARVVWSAERGEGIFLTDGLQDAPDGHAYALWAIAGDSAPALVGMFQPDEDGHASHRVADPSAGALTVAVTVEVEDGVDAPTTDPLIVGGV